MPLHIMPDIWAMWLAFGISLCLRPYLTVGIYTSETHMQTWQGHYILPLCNGVAHTHPDKLEGGGGCHPPVCGVNTHGTLKPCALSTSCTRCHPSFLLKGGGRMAPTTPDSLAACICSAMLGTAAVSVGIAGIFGWLKHSGAAVEPGSHLVEAMTSLAAVCAKTGLMR